MGLAQKLCDCGARFFTARPNISSCKNCRSLVYRETALARRLRREKDAPGSHTPAEWLKCIKGQSERCFWCHRSLRDPQGVLHATRDHLMPLIKGGSDSIENIVATCWPCNREKGVKTPGEYRVYLAKQGRPFSEVSTVPAYSVVGSADFRKALKRSAEVSTLQAEQREYVPSDILPKDLQPEIGIMVLHLAKAKAMPAAGGLVKKRSQAVANLNDYLARLRRPDDERERRKLLAIAEESA